MEIQDVVDYVTHTPTNSNPAVLRSMLEDLADEGGSGLPEVTSADNGDVLTVVEGTWAKAAPSGGGGDASFFDDLDLHTTAYHGNVTWEEAAHDMILTFTNNILDSDTVSEIVNVVMSGGNPVINGWTMTFGDHTVEFPRALFLGAIVGVHSIDDALSYSIVLDDSGEVPVFESFVITQLLAEWATGTMVADIPAVGFVKLNDDFMDAFQIAQNIIG